MSFMDKAKAKASDLVDKHGDKASAGLDKAAGVANQRTKGKYADKIGTGVQKAKDALDGLDGKDDDIPNDTVRPGDVRPGDVRPGDVRPGDVRRDDLP